MSELLTTYTSKLLSDFYDHILPEIPGYVTGLVNQALRNSAREFCMRTRSWRITIDALTVEAGIPEMELDVPDQSEVFDLMSVKLDGKTLLPRSEEDLKAQNFEWDSQVGVPDAYMMFDSNVIRLHPIPEATSPGGLYLEAAMTPRITATKLPSLLLDKYVETIAAGTKAKLMSMTKKPWSNPERALELAHEFSAECGSAAWRTAKGHTRAPLRVATVHR